MSLVALIVLAVIAAICAVIAEALIGYSPGGLLVSIGVGLIGALVGMWMKEAFDLPGIYVITSQGIDVVWTIIGSMLFLVILGFFRGRWR